VTVLSRCQRFDLRRVPIELLVKHLGEIKDKEKCQVDDEAVLMIARAAEGSVRDGLSLLDQAIAHSGGAASAVSVRAMLGLADRLQILKLFRSVMEGQVKDALELMDEQYTLGAEPAVIIKDLVETSHWITRIKTTGEAGMDTLISEPEREEGKALAEGLSLADLTRAWQILLKGFEETGFAPSPIRAAEMVVIRLCHAARLPDPAKLVRTLSGEEKSTAPSAKETPAPAPEKAEPEARAETREEPKQAPASAPVASGGAQVLAMAPEETGEDEPLTPMPQSFAAVVNLFEQKHEGVIGKYLFDDVGLVAFKPGAISFNPVRKIPATLPSRMKDLLETWTGQRWLITLANDAGEAPLREQEAKKSAALDQAAKNHPLVQTALSVFPGAKITKIKRLDEEEDVE